MGTIETKFEQYDKENPQIWGVFKKLCYEAKAKGFEHYGAKGIFEMIRWKTKTAGNDGFKANNNYTPDYARKMEKYDSDFIGFFRMRVRK